MISDRTPQVLVNGHPHDCISSRDRGLLYGDGVFETLPVRDGKPVFWQRHMARLGAGCRRLGIPVPDAGVLQAEAGTLLEGAAHCVLKIIISRGSGGRGYAAGSGEQPTRILQCHPAPDYPDTHRRDGVNVRLCRFRLAHNPRLAGIKHLNRLEQVLARSEWDDPGIQEGLVRDVDGRLVEGTMSNVFLVTGDRLVTPDLSRCGVAGIMRSVVTELARQQALPVRTAEVLPGDLDRADEVFLTNSLIGIWPVRRIDDTGYRAGPVTARLQDALAGLTAEGTDWYCDGQQETPDA